MRFDGGLRAVLLALSLAACRGGPEVNGPGDPWNQGMAGALAARAGEMASEGRTEDARTTAEEALALARRTHDQRSEGRALAVLGRLDRDLGTLQRARDLLEDFASPLEVWPLELALADALLDANRPEEALAELDTLIEDTSTWPDSTARARTEAPARRLRSVASRRLGDDESGRADDRQAQLLLTLLREAELTELRLSLALVRGDDLLALGDPANAYAQHARARTLAAWLGDLPAEARALAAQAGDLAALGRQGDAADRAMLAITCALEADDRELARRTALHALGWLDDRAESLDSLRRLRLLQVLRELDAAETESGPATPDENDSRDP